MRTSCANCWTPRKLVENFECCLITHGKEGTRLGDSSTTTPTVQTDANTPTYQQVCYLCTYEQLNHTTRTLYVTYPGPQPVVRPSVQDSLESKQWRRRPNGQYLRNMYSSTHRMVPKNMYRILRIPRDDLRLLHMFLNHDTFLVAHDSLLPLSLPASVGEGRPSGGRMGWLVRRRGPVETCSGKVEEFIESHRLFCAR